MASFERKLIPGHYQLSETEIEVDSYYQGAPFLSQTSSLTQRTD